MRSDGAPGRSRDLLARFPTVFRAAEMETADFDPRSAEIDHEADFDSGRPCSIGSTGNQDQIRKRWLLRCAFRVDRARHFFLGIRSELQELGT